MILGAVILAAGSGSRLGGVAKALLRRGPATYLAHIAETARAVSTSPFIVVVGPPHADAVAAEAHACSLSTILNPAPDRGMASSVALGFAAAMRHNVDAAWLWPVDHPFTLASTLASLIAALVDHDAARPVHAGRGGHPPLISRRLFPQLASCGELSGGARAVLAAADVCSVPVEDPGVLRDIDSPSDLAEAR